jgi:hypothetical protein
MTDPPWPAGELTEEGVSALMRGRRPFGLPGRFMRNTRYTRTKLFRAERAAAGPREHPLGSARTDGPARTSRRAGTSRRRQDGSCRAGYRDAMEERTDPSPPGLDAQVLAAIAGAQGDLERVRQALVHHERGTAGREALEVVTDHWRRHETTYRAVGRLIAEEFRDALLVELEGWRRELRQQLEGSQGTRQSPRDRERDASIAQLRARLTDTDSGLDRAEILVQLGELHAARHDDAEAERRLRAAEQELTPYRDRATGSGIAEALIEALPSMARGETRQLQTELAATMRAAQLLERVYEGLARVVEDTEEAQRFLEQQRALRESLAHGSQGTLDFKGMLLQELSQQSSPPEADDAGGEEPAS